MPMRDHGIVLKAKVKLVVETRMTKQNDMFVAVFRIGP